MPAMAATGAPPAKAACTIRCARPADAVALVQLCAEHARFERTRYEPAGKAVALRALLSGKVPRLRAWLATGPEGLVGYATASEELSTWRAAPFLHLDCLYVRPGHRNGGIGAALLRSVIRHALDSGLRQLQWQTPAWNTDAQRFYRRHGASGLGKARFQLDVG